MKYDAAGHIAAGNVSPLAEGRELKYCMIMPKVILSTSPLAEGRELKFFALRFQQRAQRRRPSRRGVN